MCKKKQGSRSRYWQRIRGRNARSGCFILFLAFIPLWLAICTPFNGDVTIIVTSLLTLLIGAFDVLAEELLGYFGMIFYKLLQLFTVIITIKVAISPLLDSCIKWLIFLSVVVILTIIYMFLNWPVKSIEDGLANQQNQDK